MVKVGISVETLWFPLIERAGLEYKAMLIVDHAVVLDFSLILTFFSCKGQSMHEEIGKHGMNIGL